MLHLRGKVCCNIFWVVLTQSLAVWKRKMERGQWLLPTVIIHPSPQLPCHFSGILCLWSLVLFTSMVLLTEDVPVDLAFFPWKKEDVLSINPTVSVHMNKCLIWIINCPNLWADSLSPEIGSVAKITVIMKHTTGRWRRITCAAFSYWVKCSRSSKQM